MALLVIVLIGTLTPWVLLLSCYLNC